MDVVSKESLEGPDNGNTSTDEDDDDDDGLDELFRTPAPDNTMSDGYPRRTSGRMRKAPDRFDPHRVFSLSQEPSVSVFDDGILTNRNKRRGKGLSISQLVRNKTLRTKQTKELEELRRDARHGTGPSDDMVDKGFELFAAVAKREEEEEALRQRRLLKYQAPVKLFTCQPQFPTQRRRLQVMTPDAFTDLICSTDSRRELYLNVEAAEDLTETTVRFCLGGSEKAPDSFAGSKLFRAIFELVVYDTSNVPQTDEDPKEKLQGAYEALRYMLRQWPSLIDTLPNLSRILATFGADIESRDDFEVKSDQELEPCSEYYNIEDDFAENPYDIQDPLTRILSRNLGRVVSLFATAVGSHTVREPGMFTKSQISSCTILCVRVMASCFGSQFSNECGTLIANLLDLIDEDDWPSYRFKLAKRIVNVTKRLFIQIELITATNLSVLTERSRHLCLECAYLVLYQWSAGPCHDPSPRSADNLVPSLSARGNGLEFISYSLGDVIETFSALPEVDKNTDLTWLSGVAHVFQLAVCDLDVLKKRSEKDLSKLMSLCGAFRKSFCRLPFVVDLNDLKISVDVIMTTVRELFALNRKAKEDSLLDPAPTPQQGMI